MFFCGELGECKWFVQERKLVRVHVLLNEFGHVSKRLAASSVLEQLAFIIRNASSRPHMTYILLVGR